MRTRKEIFKDVEKLLDKGHDEKNIGFYRLEVLLNIQEKLDTITEILKLQWGNPRDPRS